MSLLQEKEEISLIHLHFHSNHFPLTGRSLFQIGTYANIFILS